MPFNISIVEDCGGTRNILDSLLSEQITSAWPNSLPAWSKAGDPSFTIDTVDSQTIDELVEAKTPEQAQEVLERYFEERVRPNLLVLDLALNEEQRDALDDAHGREEFGINDPEETLAETAGFITLQAWKDHCPVLITTFAQNPHIVTRCLDAGAHDVVIKPLNDDDMTSVFSTLMTRDAKVANPGEKAIREAEQHMPGVETYVRCVAHEALKAIRAVALQGLEGAAPAHVPFWLATDLERISTADALDGTNLMLIDVRGFSRLGEAGKSKPAAVFEIMNVIWGEVFDVLREHEAEVNNIIGDAALAFRGVYGAVRAPVSLADTLTCARLVNELFESDRPLRDRLIEIVECNYDALVDTENRAREEMLDLVSDENFGVRVISIQPDAQEALYGKVGADHRWQHTILSRFMNFLARAESAIGGWEKDEGYASERGESFLLWRKDREDDPDFPGFSFQDQEEFRGREREEVRDLSEHVEIFRAVPVATAAEAVAD